MLCTTHSQNIINQPYFNEKKKRTQFLVDLNGKISSEDTERPWCLPVSGFPMLVRSGL